MFFTLAPVAGNKQRVMVKCVNQGLNFTSGFSGGKKLGCSGCSEAAKTT